MRTCCKPATRILDAHAVGIKPQIIHKRRGGKTERPADPIDAGWTAVVAFNLYRFIVARQMAKRAAPGETFPADHHRFGRRDRAPMGISSRALEQPQRSGRRSRRWDSHQDETARVLHQSRAGLPKLVEVIRHVPKTLQRMRRPVACLFAPTQIPSRSTHSISNSGQSVSQNCGASPFNFALRTKTRVQSTFPDRNQNRR